MLEIDDLVYFAPASSIQVFGQIDRGPETGLVVLFLGGLIKDIMTGEITTRVEVVGMIVGFDYNNDCAILEIDDGLLGWIPQNRYRILNLVTPDNKTIQ